MVANSPRTGVGPGFDSHGCVLCNYLSQILLSQFVLNPLELPGNMIQPKLQHHCHSIQWIQKYASFRRPVIQVWQFEEDMQHEQAESNLLRESGKLLAERKGSVFTQSLISIHLLSWLATGQTTSLLGWLQSGTSGLSRWKNIPPHIYGSDSHLLVGTTVHTGAGQDWCDRPHCERLLWS